MGATANLALVVGLGNPGPEYERTRHNAGFWFVDRVARKEGASLRNDGKFLGLVAKLPGAWLLEPQTWMNRSGQAVAALARFYKIAPEAILVVHDELDLKPGEAKLKLGGGTAGHNGLKDIAAQLGTPNFWRLRLGIGHPREMNLQQQVVDYVLHPPRAEEQQAMDDALKRALEVWPVLREGDMERAMHVLHSGNPKRERAAEKDQT
jgi:PTH1 family peptidyl-tRNA hydrolase